MNSIVSEKGQVTIPKKLRTDLGLEAGTVLEFEERDGKMLICKKLKPDPVGQWLGFAKTPKAESVADYMKLIRDR